MHQEMHDARMAKDVQLRAFTNVLTPIQGSSLVVMIYVQGEYFIRVIMEVEMAGAGK